MSIPIYVLSLPEADGRRKAVRAEFTSQRLKFRFFDAVDGRRAPTAIARFYDSALNAQKFKRPLSSAEIACALGHRAIWREVINGSAPVAVVFEDDVSLDPTFHSFLQTVERDQELFSEIMIKLDSSRQSGKLLTSIAGIDLVLSRRIPGYTIGYIIGRKAAIKLINQSYMVSRPIDMDIKSYWEHGVPILLTRPQLASERPNTISSIDAPRDVTKPSTLGRRMWRNLQYQFAVNISRFCTPLQREDQSPLLAAIRKSTLLKNETQESDNR